MTAQGPVCLGHMHLNGIPEPSPPAGPLTEPRQSAAPVVVPGPPHLQVMTATTFAAGTQTPSSSPIPPSYGPRTDYSVPWTNSNQPTFPANISYANPPLSNWTGPQHTSPAPSHLAMHTYPGAGIGMPHLPAAFPTTNYIDTHHACPTCSYGHPNSTCPTSLTMHQVGTQVMLHQPPVVRSPGPMNSVPPSFVHGHQLPAHGLPQPRAPIYFYHKHNPHYGFTNFSPHPVVFERKTYPTSEHLFQSRKFVHRPELAEHIRTFSDNPSVAFSEARRFSPEVRLDWQAVNIEVMEEVIRLKFNQHRSLMEELLNTGDAQLIEDSDKDSFWGIGANRQGRNELGKALERLRAKIRAQLP